MRKRHLIKLLGLTALALIGAMAMSSSAAQAKWLILLNKTSVKKISVNLTMLQIAVESGNGLKIKCSGGTGIATSELIKEDKEVVGAGSGVFTGCVWVGQEKTCIINDGGKGQIKITAMGALTMVGEEVYFGPSPEPGGLGASGGGLVITEGAFCTLPEEEEFFGAFTCQLLEPLVDGNVKLCHMKASGGGINKIEGEVHISDENPISTLAFHLVNL